MTDERLFERLAAHAGPVEIAPGFEDRLFAQLAEELHRPQRSPRPAVLLVATLVVILTIAAAAAVGSGVVHVPWLTPNTMESNSPTPTVAEPSPTEPAASTTWSEGVRGWPATRRNAPGLYSWDGARCAGGFCIVGWMHNGYGSGDVEISIERLPEGSSSGDGATAVTVAGHDGTYRQIGDGREEWIIEIEGITVAIRLIARTGTSQADLADAHAIIESMRYELRPNAPGFRLIFTLTIGEWDSG